MLMTFVNQRGIRTGDYRHVFTAGDLEDASCSGRYSCGRKERGKSGGGRHKRERVACTVNEQHDEADEKEERWCGRIGYLRVWW